MTQVSIPNGLLYPKWSLDPYGASLISGTNATLDANGEQIAMIGRCHIEGRAASKTIDTTGSSAICFKSSSATVWANGSTSVDIGIQDVSTSAGPAGQPDGSFDVKAVVVGGAGITSNAWQSIVPTTGTKTISHGDLIAVVFDMTARAGSDVLSPTLAGSSANGEPFTNENVGGAGYLNSSNKVPNVVIVFNDGTLGTIEFTHPFATASSESFSDSTNPDERGMLFQVPWDCKIDAFYFHGGFASAAADFDINLWSDPLGTPSSLAGITGLAEQRGGSTSSRLRFFQLPSEISLSKNTTYCISVKATGAGNVTVNATQLAVTGHRSLYFGTSFAKTTRNGGSGAFAAAESPALTMYVMGVRISSFDDGTGSGGGGGGMLVNPGMNGRLIS